VKVQVDREHTTAGKDADRDGFVTWERTLAGGAHERLALRYVLKKHSDVVGL
jgi:hypothetical protein